MSAPVAGQGPAEDGASEPNELCSACKLTETIPDLTVVGNREKWARLEAAKRRLLYTLDRLGLPYASATPKLTFDFKADVVPPNNEWRNAGAKEIVYTGHADGKITINLRETDDAAREALRVQFHEAHRTLIGHFHHEVGHYYWQLLVQNKREAECTRAFGDHTSPPYTDAMTAYYQSGPQLNWSTSFISAYASSHPWEDFAETFALYLDMISVLDTSTHLFKSIRANFHTRSVAPLVERFGEVGVLVNEFNRTVGLLDLVPDIVVTPVVTKLEFIHSLVKKAAKKPRVKAPPTEVVVPTEAGILENVEPAIEANATTIAAS
ncbi:MAG TPA: putative zinc-binding metallopeptidase [Lacipirellulaceae bacterium]|nr:putative zinc-binding metallopeptidase [Lacipirellulaceae bacterium]